MFITSFIPRTALVALAVSALLIALCPTALQAQQATTTGEASKRGAKGLDDPDFIGKWGFDGPEKFGPWKPLQASIFQIQAGVVHVDAKSKRPCLDLAGPYSAEQIGAIEIRIRGVEKEKPNASGSSGNAVGGANERVRILPQLYQGTRIYFTHQSKEKYDAEKSLAFEFPLDGKFHVVTITPGENPFWKGLLKKIRFDLGDFPHHYELDYIYFHRAQTGKKKGDAKGDKASGRVGAISTEPAK
jgi:hypothetical protein